MPYLSLSRVSGLVSPCRVRRLSVIKRFRSRTLIIRWRWSARCQISSRSSVGSAAKSGKISVWVGVTSWEVNIWICVWDGMPFKFITLLIVDREQRMEFDTEKPWTLNDNKSGKLIMVAWDKRWRLSTLNASYVLVRIPSCEWCRCCRNDGVENSGPSVRGYWYTILQPPR